MDVEPYPEDVEVDPYPEEVVVEPYWPVAPREPKAAAVAASISGLSSFMIWGKAVKAKSLKSHLVDKVVCLAGSLTDSLVDSGAGLLGHVGALLLVLGAALLLVLRGAGLPGSIIITIIIITCSYSVVQACRGAARQMFSVTCSHTSSVLSWDQG